MFRTMPKIVQLTAYSGLAVVVGLSSAWYMVDKGSRLTTSHSGPWSVWYRAGNPDADPYTRAHFARQGRLPVTTTSALYYTANRDDEGDRLTADCDYTVEGRPLDAAWWSIAAYRSSGRLIPNKANRYAFSNRDIARGSDGRFRIVLSAEPRPGNWLPTVDSDLFQIMLRIYGPRSSRDASGERRIDAQLPRIKRINCP